MRPGWSKRPGERARNLSASTHEPAVGVLPGAALHGAKAGQQRDPPAHTPRSVRRAPDGHTVQIVSSRPAGTVIARQGPACDRRRRFELTDAILSDGTYAAKPLDRYR
ncbi:hypothetical protein [Streptomyces sp. NBC_01207]|uniref:hypothetical protein n=1 Tax=Streptomyces sp. NBC_01207 TaxID=2903772 RepID=UPI002E0F6C5A|nr:hypothetical protein OG457_00830 [Streptomyces sp. NBC_01207]